MSFEESLVMNASPTLASIKMASLYNFRFGSIKECQDVLSEFNKLMNGKGIYIELLKATDDFYLIYVYRKTHLQKALSNSNVQRFLETYEYSADSDIHDQIEILKRRLNSEDDFPHEIGVFLGYPLDDVKDFIKTKGNNCVFCGEWKAYHDIEMAKCLFCKYKHCRDIYTKVYREGRRFSDMLVSA